MQRTISVLHPFEHGRYLMSHMLIIRYLRVESVNFFESLSESMHVDVDGGNARAYVIVQLFPAYAKLIDLTVGGRQGDFRRLEPIGNLEDLVEVRFRVRLDEAFERLQMIEIARVMATCEVPTSSSSEISSASAPLLNKEKILFCSASSQTFS